MKTIVRCTKCLALLHTKNQRYCCGVDYYVKYNLVVKTPKPKKEKPVKVKPAKVVEPKPKKAKAVKVVTDKPKKKKKRKSNKTPPETRLAVLERDNHTCTVCGSKEYLYVHHIEHKKHGGTHDMNNLTTLCEECHAEQHKGEPVYNLMIANIKRRKGQL